MTPQAWQARWRFNLLAAQANELVSISQAAFRDTPEAAPMYLHTVTHYLEEARSLLDRYATSAVERVLGEAERYLRYAEFSIIAKRKKLADPARYQALTARLQALFETPVDGIGEWGFLGTFHELEKARDAREDGEFAEADRWCERAERRLPEAIRERQEAWHERYGDAA
jgi:hypothetical protein